LLLFDPPFDATELEPGYIKGYLPGIRENGGQYTHAALWVAQAWAALGDGDRAYEVLRMLNPITHGDDAEAIARYRLEPYVVAADVYSQPPARLAAAGWSWYTGSASWFYRVTLESLLGIHHPRRPARSSAAVAEGPGGVAVRPHTPRVAVAHRDRASG